MWCCGIEEVPVVSICVKTSLIINTFTDQPTTFARVCLFVFFGVLQIGLIIYFVVRSLWEPFYILSALFMAVTVAPSFATLLFFFLVTHSMSLCYDDWTAKMLSATAKYSLRDSVKVLVALGVMPEPYMTTLSHFSSYPNYLYTKLHIHSHSRG